MSMTEHRTKQCILKAVRGGYVTLPPVDRSVFANIAIGNGGRGDESLTRGTSNPDTISSIEISVGILVLDIRALGALMCRLRSPVPHGHVLGYIRARILVIVPLRVCSGSEQTRRFSPS